MGQNFQNNRRPMQGAPNAGPVPGGARPGAAGGARPMFPAPQMGAFPQGQQPARGAIKFNAQARNQNGQMSMPGMMPQQMMAQQQLPPQMGLPQSKLDFSNALLTADPTQQKNMIGERLFPLIYQHQPDLAGKITGMLLEMDNAELINLIESPEALTSKIDEALAVLRNHSNDN